MEFINFLREQFQASTFELAFVVLGVIGLFILGVAVAAFRKSEVYRQHKDAIDVTAGAVKALGEYILDQIVRIEASEADLDLSKYEDRTSERVEQGFEYIDPRMLYLMDKLDDYLSRRSGVNLSFDELLAKAEHIFQLYKNGDLS